MGDNAVVDEGSSTVTRRDVMKKGAIAGGVVLWATPVVQAVGIGRAHAQETSPGPTPPTDPTGKDISNIQIVVLWQGGHYGLKYDEEGFNEWSSEAPAKNNCLDDWGTVGESEALAALFNADPGGAQVQVISDSEWRLLLPLPDGALFVAGFVKTGTDTSPCPSAGTVQAGPPPYIPFIST